VNTESKRLVIQNFRESDIVTWAEIDKDPLVRRYIDGKTLSYDQAAAYVHRNIDHYDDKGFSRYAVRYKATDQLIGMCGFLEEDYGIDFGYRYIPAFWGMGIGLEAAKAVLQIGLPEPRSRTVYGIVALKNFGSIRILEKLDFQLIDRTIMHGLEALKYKYVIRNLENQSGS
jgi:ribosomal-protein-alanine N-acetyltransferase